MTQQDWHSADIIAAQPEFGSCAAFRLFEPS